MDGESPKAEPIEFGFSVGSGSIAQGDDQLSGDDFADTKIRSKSKHCAQGKLGGSAAHKSDVSAQDERPIRVLLILRGAGLTRRPAILNQPNPRAAVVGLKIRPQPGWPGRIAAEKKVQ